MNEKTAEVTLQNWIGRIVAFIVAAGLMAGVQALLVNGLAEMFNIRSIPRGLGWLIPPVVAGFASAKRAPEIQAMINEKFAKSTKETRLIIVSIGSWVVLSCLLISLVKPFGRRMYHNDYIQAAEWISITSFAGLIVWYCIKWGMRGR